MDLYNYDDLGLRVDIIQNADFYGFKDYENPADFIFKAIKDSKCDDIGHDQKIHFQVRYIHNAAPQEGLSSIFIKPNHVSCKRTCNQHHTASQPCRIEGF